jgi:alkaline phosphatase D
MRTPKHGVLRRHFLKSTAAAAPALLIRQSPVRFSSNPFTLGVASGYPLSEGFVIWTRLAPVPLMGGGMPPSPVVVEWEVASDDRMANVVRNGSAIASPDWAHSVHVEVEELEPERPYWYRFHVGSEESAVGRSRTAPLLESTPERLRFAFASCQHYEKGYYSAYRHMIADEPDLVIHLGDYIYEGKASGVRVRRHAAPEPVTLEDYRNRYAQYKSDTDLQAAHAAAPWLVTWDDHEVDNDYADLASEELHPEAWFRRRRTAAYHAYYEHMPLRRSAAPLGEHLRLYTEVAYGELARFQVLDDRQYRSPQVCPRPGEGGSNTVADCPARLDPSLTLLGDAQEAWLHRNLERSTARWNILAQQTLMAELDRAPGPGRAFWTDGWDGYPAARARLLEFIAESAPRNPLVIGGDVHAFWVSDLKTDFRDEHAKPIASEIVGGSITSSGMPEERRAAIQKDNPHIQYGNSARHGYARVELTKERAQVDLRAVGDVTDPDTGIETLASFEIEDGRPGPREI